MHETVAGGLPDFGISKDMQGSVFRSIEHARRTEEVHPAFAVVIDRLMSGNPQNHADGHMVGLRVEGGGMGAVVTAYMLGALELLGNEVFEADTRFAFDQIEFRSAANFNTLWWLSGKILQGKSTYHSHLAGAPFRNTPFSISSLSLNKDFQPKKSFLNTSYFRELIDGKAELNWEKINEWQGKIEVVGTRVGRKLPKNAGRAVRFADFAGLNDLINALFACSHIPIVSSKYFPPKPNMYRGMHIWDGGIAEGIPVTINESEELCTDVITLLTLPKGFEYNPNPPAQDALALAYMWGWDPEVARLYKEKPKREYYQRKYLQKKEARRDGPPYVSAVMRPSGSQHVALMEHNPLLLQRAGEEGAKALFTSFGIRDTDLQDALVQKMRTYFYR